MFRRKDKAMVEMINKAYVSESIKWRGVFRVAQSVKCNSLFYFGKDGDVIIAQFSKTADGKQREEFYYRTSARSSAELLVFAVSNHGTYARIFDDDNFFSLPKEYKNMMFSYRSAAERKRMGIGTPTDDDYLPVKRNGRKSPLFD